jgi:hypothetical protein
MTSESPPPISQIPAFYSALSRFLDEKQKIVVSDEEINKLEKWARSIMDERIRFLPALNKRLKELGFKVSLTADDILYAYMHRNDDGPDSKALRNYRYLMELMHKGYPMRTEWLEKRLGELTDK